MLLLDRNYLLPNSREKPLEQLTAWDFRIDQAEVYAARLVAFIDKEAVKVFKNYNGLVGIYSYAEFKKLLTEKLENYENS